MSLRAIIAIAPASGFPRSPGTLSAPRSPAVRQLPCRAPGTLSTPRALRHTLDTRLHCARAVRYWDAAGPLLGFILAPGHRMHAGGVRLRLRPRRGEIRSG
jgi:hypothetical protein